jgi:penicillin-binding protein 2
MNFFKKSNKKINFQSAEIDNPIQISSLRQDSDELTVGEFSQSKQRSKMLLFFFIVSLLVLMARTFYLQIIRGEYYAGLSENNRIRSIVIKAPRGVIKDCRGAVLAKNIPGFDLVFIPSKLPGGDELKRMLDELSAFLDVPERELEEIIHGTDYFSKETYFLKENISHETALRFVEKSDLFPGIYLEKTAKREYTDGEIFSFILGYTGKVNKEELNEDENYLITDYKGKDGLEYFYDQQIRGRHGAHKVEVDSRGNIQDELEIVNPQPGSDLVLNIDSELQKKAYAILKKTMEENEEADAAALVAIDPRNGGVKALINFPSYDNNLFSNGISREDLSKLINDDRKLLLNRAIGGEYPPGSIFKPIVAAAALEEKIIQEETVINCSGLISVGQWNFPDWKTHGITDVKKAIAESCNVFFYALGGGWNGIEGLGIDKIKKYANLFGLGNLTGIDIPGERSGNIPDEKWKLEKMGEKWYIGDDYHVAIGQGFITVTPLQMAMATAAIANGGTFFQPQLVDKIISVDGSVNDLKPVPVNSGFISKENIKIVKAGMRETVFSPNGSGRLLSTLEVETAGKTGTAQFGAQNKTHSWYSSFGPYENPEIAMVILVEGGGEGHDWAVPVTKEIYDWYFSRNQVPDNETDDQPILPAN